MSRAIWICAALALLGAPSSANAHGSHVVVAVKGPKHRKQKIEPARVIIYRSDLTSFADELRKLGHHVDVAADAETLHALLRTARYDLAVVPLEDAHGLLDEIRLRMIVPLVSEKDDRMRAEEFSINIPLDRSQLKRQLEEFHRALRLLPR